MMKLIAAVVWGAFVAVAAGYGASMWQTQKPAEVDPEAAVTTQIKVKMMSVPIISGGEIQGYVLTQLVFTVNDTLYKRLPQPADVFLTDEAFRAVYNEDKIDFKKLQKQDLGALAQRIVTTSNQRFGAAIVQDVLIQELNYVTKAETRRGR